MNRPRPNQSPSVNPETPTRERILNVAEKLFAMHGLDRVSIRDIAREAQVNLGAVNYHFQSRETLVVEVFSRCISPLNRARLEALDAVEKNSGAKGPSVAEILGSFIRPAVELAFQDATREQARNLLMGRAVSESDPALQEWLRTELEPLIRRYDGALHRALPQLAYEDIFWGMSFTFGALNHFLISAAKPVPEWIKIKTPLTGQVERLIKFAVAGICANAPSKKNQGPL
jgi:AcrR family transcriptional regulator